MKNNTIITSIEANEAYLSRGIPAVEVTVCTSGGAKAVSVLSTGTSVADFEAPSIYDGGKKYYGKGVSKAVSNVNEIIAPALLGHDSLLQSECDSVLMALGKEKLGANATAPVSTAILKSAALSKGIELFEHIGGKSAFTLPIPSHNSATGSMRYGNKITAGNKPTYSFVAYGFSEYDEASYALWELLMDWADLMTVKLGIKVMIDNGFNIPKNKLYSDKELWKMMADIIEKHHMLNKIGIQVDVGANGFYNKDTKQYEGIFSPEPKTRQEMIKLICKIPKEYPFVIIEDPLEANDFEGFAEITKNTEIQIVGDDLFASHKDRFLRGVALGACNSILISTAQIGTVTEAFKLAVIARECGYGITVSGSRGEEVDICDYAVGLSCGTIRECGLSFSGNRLLYIKDKIGKRAKFYGRNGLSGKIGKS